MSQDRNCEDCQSRTYGLLCHLEGPELKALSESKFHHQYQSGQSLFYAGNAASGVYCVVSGTIKLESQDDQGKNQMVQVYGPGSLIGYRALFSDLPYQSSAVAVDQAEVCFIPKSAILELVKNNPELAIQFLGQLSRDFRMMESRLQRVVSNSASERIAEALLFLRENFEDKNWTRKEIAEWAGTTPETVMRTLAEFEKEGMIRLSGRVIDIQDRKRLLAHSKILI